MKKIIMTPILVLLLFIMGTIAAFAEEGISIKAVWDSGDNPVFYVGSMEGEVKVTQALVGNEAAQEVFVTPIQEEEVSVKTLILLDNSLSIPEKIRSEVIGLTEEIIAGRGAGEQFALGNFGENFEELSGFTDDYLLLKEKLSGLEFIDRKTYLTDVLYGLLEEDYFGYSGKPVFSRILIISDGVDDQSLGYTGEELSEKLETYRIPIYTVGVYNNKQSNEEALSELFALSRRTNGISFLLDEVDIMQILDAMAQDRNTVRIEVVPASASLDGEKKTVSFTLESANETISLQADNVRMAQVMPVKEEEPTAAAAKELLPEEPVSEEPEQEAKKENSGSILPVVIIAAAALVVSVLLILGTRAAKARKEKNILREVKDPFEPAVQGTATEFIEAKPSGGSDGETLMMFQDDRRCTITLTDMDSPAKRFQKELVNRLVIGRSTKDTDICIDYDKSVSSVHCAIEKQGEAFLLIDLNSSNGTYLNENRVLSQVEICSGSVIRLGRVRLKVEMG